MIRYVVGLMFDLSGTYVALVRKNRPKWQAGRLNGIGGHVEDHEWTSPIDAMVREFHEETGVATTTADWTPTVILEGQKGDFAIDFYTCRTEMVWETQTMTDEPIEVHVVTHVMPMPDLLPNLRWIMPFSLDPCAKLPLCVMDAPAQFDLAYAAGRTHA